MKLIAGIFVTLFLIVTSEAQICTQIQGCDLTISDRCYAYVDDSLNWNQAENCCVAWGGHLASIHSYDDNNILNSIRNQSRCTWIGLSNTDNVSEYVWSDGTTNDYGGFYLDPPDSNGEVCFHYLSEEYYWDYYDCSSDTCVDQESNSYPISYICQKMISEDQFCTPIQGCDVTINGSCYAHVDDSLNWNQAENCCVAWGGHLASIHSNDTNTILNGIRNQGRSTWIGLSDTANDGVYVWTDGTQYGYENFASGQPNSNGEYCFFFLDGALTWHDYQCSRSTLGVNILTSYICQKRQFTSVCDNRVISNVSVTGGICYEESLETDMRDWNSAFNNCSSTNRKLARVLNEEMSAEIERITQDTDEYWIGLSRSNSSSEFMWSDGTNLSDTRWINGHPMDGLNCVSVRGNSTEWYSSNCSDVKRYVCETEVCEDWIVRNGICYKRFDTEIDADAAISFCQSQNAYLAEIPNIYVDNVITEIIGDLGGGGGRNEHWFGLRTNATHYYWRIGDFSLGNDTPSDNVRNRCGAVDENDGNRWIIRDCNSMRRTICMRGPLTNEIPIERCENSSADTLVCEDSCYTQITVNRRNLDRATLTCTDYYNGTLYDLSNATVNKEIRRKFGSGNDLIVVDPNEYSRFTAQDGYFNLFTSVGGNNYTDNPNCLTIDSEGGFSSGGCSGNDRSYIYICKRAKTTPTITTTIAPTTTMEATPPATTTTSPTISPPTYSNYSYTYPCDNVIDNIDNTGGVCYTANSSDNVTWDSANMKCVENGNSILAKALVHRMSAEIERITQSTDEYWIGLSRPNSSSEFMWSDGTNLSYTRWSSGHPIDGLNCVSVRGNSTEWYSRNCSDVKRYVCETDVCKDWTVRNGICYKKFDSNTNWTNSVEFCKNETAFLAEIPNIFINDIISGLILSNEECYIGMYEDSTGLAWRIGEFAVTESNSTSVTATSADIRYGTMYGSGKWNLGDGDTDRCVVCMRGNPSPQSFSNYQCNRVTENDVNDTVYDSSCYRRLRSTTANLDIVTYRCQNFENGELYTFDNPDLNIILLERFETDTFLIQSRDQYTGFIPPNNSFNLLATNETYNFSDYTCENVSKDGINTYAPPDGETCEDSSRIYFCKTDYTPRFSILKEITFNETLYQLIAHNRNFGEARDYCNNQKGKNDMNGHLMEILNQQQQQQVLLNLTSTVNQYVDEYYWIGLEYNTSDYVWTSGDVANYIVNITNLTSADSYCVAVDRDGNWLGLDCSDRYSFICQIPHVLPTAVTNATNMSTSPATSMTTNMSTSPATSMTTNMSTSTTSMTAIMSTNTATSMTASMSTSTSTSMTASMSTSTSTSMPPNVIVMNEKLLEEFLEKNTNLTVGGIATEFNEEIKADIIAVHLDSNNLTNITFESVTVGIGSDSFQANAIIVSAVYRNTSDFTSSEMILSDVITIVSSEELSRNLTITFTIIQILQINGSSCYSFQNGTWVTDGIETTRMENTVICETSHLTTFAVLIDPTLATAQGDHIQYQAYISVILCGLSLAALLTTIILYLCIGKKFFRKDINIIQLNFVIALCFALITFFLLTIPYFAMTALPPQACGAIALLTHYCWLSVFSWNFCQALHIILALFGNKLPFERHYIPLILIGWGIPIPIVIVTLGVGLVQGEYQHAESCFLSTENGLIWAFLGPIFFIILVNTCILIFIIVVSIYVQRKRRHKLAYSWRLVIGIATTIPLLGLPWIVGLLLRVIPNTDITFIVANYIFIIVNASQGLIFFVVHVIRNQEIRTLCSSSLKADIDIHPDDKEKKKERESIEGKLRGTEGTFSLRHDVISTHFSNNLEKNEMFQNDYTDRV